MEEKPEKNISQVVIISMCVSCLAVALISIFIAFGNLDNDTENEMLRNLYKNG